jgi:hypothetical protein
MVCLWPGVIGVKMQLTIIRGRQRNEWKSVKSVVTISLNYDKDKRTD